MIGYNDLSRRDRKEATMFNGQQIVNVTTKLRILVRIAKDMTTDNIYALEIYTQQYIYIIKPIHIILYMLFPMNSDK